MEKTPTKAPRTNHPYLVTYDTPVPGQELVIHRYKSSNASKVSSPGSAVDIDKYSTLPMPPTHKGRSVTKSLTRSSRSSQTRKGIPHKTWSTAVSETDFKVIDYVNEVSKNPVTPDMMPNGLDQDQWSEVTSVRSLKSACSGYSLNSSVLRQLASGRHTQISRGSQRTPAVHGRESRGSVRSVRPLKPPSRLSRAASVGERDREEVSPTPGPFETYSDKRTVRGQSVSRMSTFHEDLENFGTEADVLKQGRCTSRLSEATPSELSDKPAGSRRSVETHRVNQYTAYQAMYNPVLHTLKWKVGRK